MFRGLNASVLILTLVEQGELDAAEDALAPLDCEAKGESLIAAMLRFAPARLRLEQGRTAEGLDDILALVRF